MRLLLDRDLVLAILGFAFGSVLITASAGAIIGSEEVTANEAAQHLI